MAKTLFLCYAQFGTDFPWGDTPKIIKNIEGLGIPEEEQKMIFGENAMKLFNLE